MGRYLSVRDISHICSQLSETPPAHSSTVSIRLDSTRASSPTEGDMSTFALKVEAAIRAIEAGELRSYGELAARAGSSKASLACARVRHNLYEAGRDEDLPLHRVMSSKVCR